LAFLAFARLTVDPLRFCSFGIRPASDIFDRAARIAWRILVFEQEMKHAFSLLFVCAFSLAFPHSSPAGTTDYALMSATPYNSEIALGRERVEKFLYKANAKQRSILAQTPVVAVEAAVLPAAETGPLLRRIESGEFGIGNGGRPADQASRQVFFVLLFDSRTGQLVSDDGVLVLNTPQRGKIGQFGGVTAIYIGKGL
jgi:hypothetical protein